MAGKTAKSELIRQDKAKHPEMTNAELAKKYKVASSHVHNALKGKGSKKPSSNGITELELSRYLRKHGIEKVRKELKGFVVSPLIALCIRAGSVEDLESMIEAEEKILAEIK